MEKVEVNSKRWLSLEDFEEEEWKFIPDTRNMYSISNYGRVRREPRTFNIGDGIERNLQQCIRKLSKNKQGYWACNMSIDGNRKSFRINRLVADAFVPNPNNYPISNHIDEDKGNNHYTNLEFCSYSYNTTYGKGYTNRCENIRKTRLQARHLIKQYTLDGIFVNQFYGYKEVEKAGYSGVAVLNCCEHRSKQSCGYVWRFEDEPFEEPVYIYDPANSKRVAQYDLEMNLIRIFNSISEATKSIGIKNRTKIRLCCEGKIESIYGYIWKYKED